MSLGRSSEMVGPDPAGRAYGRRSVSPTGPTSFIRGGFPVRVFAWREVREAVAYAKAGGQALHLHRVIVNRAKAPHCFVAAVDRGEFIAHLFDQDAVRLRATARKLGVKSIYIHRAGTDAAHVDLCGAPLRRAYALVESEKLAVILKVA